MAQHICFIEYISDDFVTVCRCAHALTSPIPRVKIIGMDLHPDAFFSALGHPTRLRCLMLLMQQQELCVCDLTRVIAESQPHLSRHLARLRELGLVCDRREGVWIHYRLNPEIPLWAYQVLQATRNGTAKLAPYCDDRHLIEEMELTHRKARCA